MFILLGISFSLGLVLGIVEIRFLDNINDFLYKAKCALQNAWKGNLGERGTFKRLKQLLGDEYRIYPNFKIPGTEFDNDVIIL